MTQLFGVVQLRSPRDTVLIGSEFTVYQDASCMTPIAHVLCARMTAFRFTAVAPATVVVQAHRPVWTNAGSVGPDASAQVPPFFVNRTITEVTVSGSTRSLAARNLHPVIEPLWDARSEDNRSWQGGRSQAYFHPFVQQGLSFVPCGSIPLAQSSAVETQTRQYFADNATASGQPVSLEQTGQIDATSSAATTVSRSSGVVWALQRASFAAGTQVGAFTPYRVFDLSLSWTLNTVALSNPGIGPYSAFFCLGYQNRDFIGWVDGSAFNLLTSGGGLLVWSIDMYSMNRTTYTTQAAISSAIGPSRLQMLPANFRLSLPVSIIEQYFPLSTLGNIQMGFAIAPALSRTLSSLPYAHGVYSSARGEPLYASTNLRMVGGST